MIPHNYIVMKLKLVVRSKIAEFPEKRYSSVSYDFAPCTFVSGANKGVASKVIQGSHGYQPALAVVEQSLKLLNTCAFLFNSLSFHPDSFTWTIAYIDLYLIHSPLSGKRKRLEAYKALIDKKAEGKIRSIGVSN